MNHLIPRIRTSILALILWIGLVGDPSLGQPTGQQPGRSQAVAMRSKHTAPLTLSPLFHSAKNGLWRWCKRAKPRYWLVATILVAVWWYAGIVDPKPADFSLRHLIVWVIGVVWFVKSWPRKK